ncbi:23S rRNA (adenine(2503)-C(2))-methyltransferase RlmN [Pontiella sulfatireligans]|uniref:Ribosomal RNA large subunit methyltransferase Cfr n=1 Tax=Pontiella sulfatireligans TaxID=2750658 RepID=A0A6C2UL26_9BACT|nr:23S rRNA (adenine(2503)-C(2))-methyltransferase RlmN [Pontiella sulfatireligans]VGO20111.1 Ribosomal RNA large subunit methyltransferase Cfr [Pontiella sulfatireligans]
MLTIYDTDAIDEIRIRNAVQPHRMKLFRNALFKKSKDWSEALAQLPEEARSDFTENIRFQCLELAERHDSEIDGASKLIFQTPDHHLIESVVLRPKSGRTSICISSQVGCACCCSFCATGMMGFTRNLTVGEILDQVAQANRMLRPEGRTVRNVVFMGMGEPLLNLAAVFEAVTFLKAPAMFNLAGARITVSTVGIPPGMDAFTQQFPDVQLALSLHSARQEVRERLMPQARKYLLDRLREALLAATCNGKVMIEYLMLDGVNDGEEDLLALEDYLRGIPVHINIIPFNEYAGNGLRGTPQAERKAFADRLKKAGFDVTLRYSLGADIAAACGQLVQHKRKGSVDA